MYIVTETLISIDGIYEDSIKIGDLHFTFEEILDKYKFLDGSKCGLKKEEYYDD